jgi:hypothetical protein
VFLTRGEVNPYQIGPLKEAEAIAVEVKTLLPEYCVSVVKKRDIAFPYQIKLSAPEAANKALERPLARNTL